MVSRPSYPLIGAMLAALAAIALAAFVAWRLTQPDPVALSGGNRSLAVAPQIDIGGPFELTDNHGKRVTDKDFRGKFMLVYFGYGYCPDVCPTELQNIAAALDKLGDAAEAVQPIFITVDPQRDTVAFLADYVPLFSDRLIGLTGSPEEIDKVAKAYRVYYAKAPNGAGKDDYLVDHTSFVYLMGRDGTFLTMFRGGTDPAKMARTITGYMEAKS